MPEYTQPQKRIYTYGRNIKDVQTSLSTEEKITSGGYYVVGIHDPHLLSTGYPDSDYEVVAPNLKVAIDLAEKLHNLRWYEVLADKFTPENVSHPFAVQKVEVKELTDEEFLDQLWNSPYKDVYMHHWEPDITTKKLASLIRLNEPSLVPTHGYKLIETFNQPLESEK